MDVAGIQSDRFRHACCKSDQVVLRHGLNFANSLYGKPGLLANVFHRFFRNPAFLQKNLAHLDLHAEPGAKLVLLGPDFRHIRGQVAIDHSLSWGQVLKIEFFGRSTRNP